MPVSDYSKFCVRLDALLMKIKQGEYKPRREPLYEDMGLLSVLIDDELVKATKAPIKKDLPIAEYIISVKLTPKGDEFLNHGGYSNFKEN